MKKILILALFVILFELLTLSCVFSMEKSYRIHDIVKFIEIFEKAQEKIGIEIINFNFERENGRISGFIDFIIPEDKEEEFNAYLKDNRVNIYPLGSGRVKIHVFESYFTPVPRDFYSAFRYSLITMLTNKNFYLLIILSIVFYTLILPNLLKI